MTTATATTDTDTKPAMPGYLRMLYGGCGAMLPLVVIGLANDFSTVFASLTLVTALGYIAKAVILFGIGGFVSSLYRSETDPLKCVILGIGAPAMITTWAASPARAGGDIPAQFPPPPEMVQAVRVVDPGFFNETLSEQFQRGFFGKETMLSLYVVSAEADQVAAQTAAASVWTVLECGIGGRVIGYPAENQLVGTDPSGAGIYPLVAKPGSGLPQYLAIVAVAGPSMATQAASFDSVGGYLQAHGLIQSYFQVPVYASYDMLQKGASAGLTPFAGPGPILSIVDPTCTVPFPGTFER